MAKPLVTKRRPNLIHAALLRYKTLQGLSGSTNKDPRSFDVLVDGEKIATQTLEIHPGELFDFEYPLPEQLMRGKERITMKFLLRPQRNGGKRLRRASGAA
jgi:hypothetical protein